MNGKQLRAIRDALGLKQRELAERLRITSSSVARMEQGRMIITPPMELLIEFVAREAGVEPTYAQRSRGAASSKKAHRGKTRDPIRKDRRGERR